MLRYGWVVLMLCATSAFAPAALVAEQSGLVNRSTFGQPGLIDMPSGQMVPDGELAFTSSHFAGQTRNTLAFQLAPRVSVSLGYARLEDTSARGVPVALKFDRSLSVAVQLTDAPHGGPSVKIGLNDILGTGLYRSEYIAATQAFGTTVQATVGIGWGRLAGVGGFSNPLAVVLPDRRTRATRVDDEGGQIELSSAFSGDAALFGGLEWRATERLRFLAEYSSDAYRIEDGFAFSRDLPINLGLVYTPTDRISFGASYLYGSEIGLRFSYALNPVDPPRGTSRGNAPYPVRPRAVSTPLQIDANDMDRPTAVFAAQGLVLHGLAVTGAIAHAAVENAAYVLPAQAVGRAARALTHVVGPEVTTFEVTMIERGLPVSEITLSRADLVRLEHQLENVRLSRNGADIAAADWSVSRLHCRASALSFGAAPYLRPALFDPDDPLRADVGVDLTARYQFAPGVFLSATLRQRLAGNLDEATRRSTSDLPRVRSEAYLHGTRTDTTLTNLTLAVLRKLGTHTYGRVSAGYLEPMFAGLSGELLWYPTQASFALGAELNYAVQRNFDEGFGLRDYDVVSGHISGYFDLSPDYRARIDVGRYLAGDWGGTLTLTREFANGWSIGAFSTLTDVPFDRFGEGSFDKGIEITVPLSWVSAASTRERRRLVLRPVLRDGGALLDVPDRLYETVRPSHGRAIAESWGAFWQ